MIEFILFFESIGFYNISKVGGKNASLGEMYNNLTKSGVNIPYGFAITTDSYDKFMEYNGLYINNESSFMIREKIIAGSFPQDLENAIIDAYKKLSNFYQSDDDDETEVAVRSSSIGEDSITNSFAGQQDTFLNVRGSSNLLLHVKKCFASLFTDRVISYRKSINYKEVPKMAICVQKMVRSDLGSSGVLFTIDTESGFRDAIIINGSYGLGELIVGGIVDPD